MDQILTLLDFSAWNAGKKLRTGNLPEVAPHRPLPRVMLKRHAWHQGLVNFARVAVIVSWSHRWRTQFLAAHTTQQWLAKQLNIEAVTSRAVVKTVSAAFLAFILFILPLLARNALAEEPASGAIIPTRLVIPSLGLDQTVIPVGWKSVVIDGQAYGQWLVDDNAIGWHNLSAPLGQGGNTVLNGHSDIYARVFRNLGEIEIGDEIIAFAASRPYRYVVARKVLVREKGAPIEERIENARLIMPTIDERLTLITCAKPGATHRLIVIAYPVAP